MLAWGATEADGYEAALGEDRFVEWWTVALFAAAAVVRGRDAWARRRIWDLLVALFCVFVAGEEFSWGQRLLGFTPPPVFLESNTQQEFTLHNFADLFGKPKGVLILALFGYGVAMPLTTRLPGAPGLLRRIGATAPPLVMLPAFAAATILLVWYPLDFTGEWVEALAGGLFLTSAPGVGAGLAAGAMAGGALAAVGLTWASARAAADPAALACARMETRALLLDLTLGGAAEADLLRSASIHKRLAGAVDQGYVDATRLSGFGAVRCVGGPAASAAERRRYRVDPWGMAYWIRSERDADGARRLSVYSMGPNRRRDARGAEPRGDDVIATATAAE